MHVWFCHFFQERIREPRKSPHLHSHGEIVPLLPREGISVVTVTATHEPRVAGARTLPLFGTGANALRGYFLFRSPRRDPRDMDRVADHICGTLFAFCASEHPETLSIHS